MSYQGIEDSTDLGKPVTLFEFIYGSTAGDAYRYATTELPLNVAGRTWLPQNLRHSDIVSAGSLDRAELTVTARADIEVARLYIAAPPSTPVVLNIWRGHSLSGMEGWDEFRHVWSGRVLSAEPVVAEVEFKCEPIATSAKRVGLRRHQQYGCTHPLYGRACGLSILANTRAAVVANITSPLILEITWTGTALPPADLIGGVFTLRLPDGREELRTIVRAQASGTKIKLELLSPIPAIAEGAAVSLARGCDHTFTRCQQLGNVGNFGGCPNIPKANPFRNNTF